MGCTRVSECLPVLPVLVLAHTPERRVLPLTPDVGLCSTFVRFRVPRERASVVCVRRFALSSLFALKRFPSR